MSAFDATLSTANVPTKCISYWPTKSEADIAAIPTTIWTAYRSTVQTTEWSSYYPAIFFTFESTDIATELATNCPTV
jgi:hypothetical protein